MIRSGGGLRVEFLAAALVVLVVGCGGGDGGSDGPAPPTGFFARSDASGEVTVDWTPAAGNVSHNLYWTTTPPVTKATANVIAGVSPPYTHAGLSNGTTYYYAVATAVGAQESPLSSEGFAMPLEPPVVLSTSSGTSEVRIEWGPVAGATGYELYWATSPGVSRTTGALIPWVTSPFIHPGLTDGTTYYYVLVASNAAGGGARSSESAEVSATPVAPPAWLQAAPGDGEVTLTWAFVPGATAYNVYWALSSGVTRTSGIRIPAATSPYTHGSLNNGTTYYYTVTALSATGESIECSETSATPSMGAPSGVRAIGGDSEVTILWDPVGGATSYNVYWDLQPGVTKASPNRIVGAISPQAHIGLANGTTYYYVVTALGGAGEGPESAEVSATPGRSGSPDGSFGSSGVFVHGDAAGGMDEDAGLAIALDGSGRILVTGYSINPRWDRDMVIWRLDDTGSLDSTFNGQGWVVHDSAAGGDWDDAGLDIITDGSGRILVTGYSGSGTGDDDMVIWAYDSTGSLDASFGSGGIVVHDNAAGGNGWDEGRGIALDGQGRILVTGSSDIGFGSGLEMVIWRYDAAGIPDPTFRGVGYTIHGNAAGGDLDDVGEAVAVDALGRIVVAGRSYGGATSLYDMVLWRFDDTGWPDTTFNGQGWVVQSDAAGGNGFDSAYDLGIDPSGRFITAGESYGGSTFDMALWAHDPSGVLDASFGAAGIVAVDGAAGGAGYDAGTGLQMDASGRLVVSGISSGPSNYDMVLWRYDSTGAPDLTFGTGGVAVHDNAAGGSGLDGAEDLVIDAFGRIVAAGWSDGPSNREMVVWRFHP